MLNNNDENNDDDSDNDDICIDNVYFCQYEFAFSTVLYLVKQALWMMSQRCAIVLQISKTYGNVCDIIIIKMPAKHQNVQAFAASDSYQLIRGNTYK